MTPKDINFELVIGTQFGPYVYAFNSTYSRLIGDFTADISTNVLTLVAHGLANGDQIVLSNSNTPPNLPTPLIPKRIYYVINATTDTLKLSLTSGGSAIDILDEGLGRHKLTKRGIPLDLTGWTFYSWVKDNVEDADSAILLDLGPTIISPATNGLVQILKVETDSWGMAAVLAVHSLIGISPADVRLCFTRGKFNIVKVSTHPPE